MKARKKPIETIKPADLGVDPAPRLTALKVAEPPKRQAGQKVGSVAELVSKLRDRSEGDLSMAALVLLDHENGEIKQPSRSAVAAARKLGEVHVLVAGERIGAAAAAAAKLPGVTKVHKAEARPTPTRWPSRWPPCWCSWPGTRPPARRLDGHRQERDAARGRPAGRAADQRHLRRGRRRHLHPPDLRRQRAWPR